MTKHADRTNAPAPRQHRRPLSRVAFYSHLWVGVVFTVALAVISITGIALNHKRGLGLMPDVKHQPSGAFDASLPIAELGDVALRAAGVEGDPLRLIDRMDVRPRNGFVKVRLRDAASTEVTVDLTDGSVLHVGARGDVFLEKLHSGEAFGARWVLLSDAAAIALLITLVSGYWLWLAPKVRRLARREPGDGIAGGGP
jgi:hypothetical protein